MDRLTIKAANSDGLILARQEDTMEKGGMRRRGKSKAPESGSRFDTSSLANILRVANGLKFSNQQFIQSFIDLSIQSSTPVGVLLL